MKLDRNMNPDGAGKYALINMCKLAAYRESNTIERVTHVQSAIDTLVATGIITLGNESPGDRFFVMKYKDKFTANGLCGYLKAVNHCIANDCNISHDELRSSLREYADDILKEIEKANAAASCFPD